MERINGGEGGGEEFSAKEAPTTSPLCLCFFRFCYSAMDGPPADALGSDFTVVHRSPVKMRSLLIVYAVHISEITTANRSAENLNLFTAVGLAIIYLLSIYLSIYHVRARVCVSVGFNGYFLGFCYYYALPFHFSLKKHFPQILSNCVNELLKT